VAINTILTDKFGHYEENGGWKMLTYTVDLTSSTQVVIHATQDEIYQIKRDTAYWDDHRNLWINWKCVDAGNNPGLIRLESYDAAKSISWDGIPILATLYIDFPNITYAYKLKM
jgi:hypothetical protein